MINLKDELEKTISNYKEQLSNLRNNHGLISKQEPFGKMNSEVEILERDIKIVETLINCCKSCYEEAFKFLKERNIDNIEDDCLTIGDTFKLDGSDETCKLVVICPEKKEEGISYIPVLSPIGKGIIGSHVGDTIKCRIEGQKEEVSVTVTSIDRLEAKAKVK